MNAPERKSAENPDDGQENRRDLQQSGSCEKGSVTDVSEKRGAWQQLAGVVARTKLDLDACRNLADRALGQKAPEREYVKSAPGDLAPQKEKISFKDATPCNSVSMGASRHGKVSFCEQCHLQVYDFDNMDRSEVEALVFQREQRRDACFYRRQDGKFLTVDCPVGIRNVTGLRITMVVAALVALGLLAFAILMPRNLPRPSSGATAGSLVPASQRYVPYPEVARAKSAQPVPKK